MNEQLIEKSAPSGKEGGSLSNLWYSIHQSKFLPPSSHIEDGRDLKLVNFGIFILILLLSALLIWAGLTDIEEVAVTNGQIVPVNRVQLIQHLEGGIISKVLVKDGQLVQKGQVLALFDPAQAVAELRQIEIRDAAVVYGAIRNDTASIPTNTTNTSENNDISLNISEKNNSENKTNASNNSQKGYEPSEVLDSESNNTQINNAEIKAKSDNTTKIKKRTIFPEVDIDQADGYQLILNALSREKELLGHFEGQIFRIDEELNILKEQLAMIEALRKEGAATTREYLDIKLELARIEYEKSKLLSDHLETRYVIEKLKDRVDRLEVRSPITGIVKGIQIDPGRVIQPAGNLMEIVPSEEALVLEVRISTSDIGHVKVGQSVKVKILTYNYTQYGTILGVLSYIAASSTIDEKGIPYFKGVVKLEHPYVGSDPNQYQVKSGMTAQADVKTGVKSLLRSLLTPIQIIATSSFHER